MQIMINLTAMLPPPPTIDARIGSVQILRFEIPTIRPDVHFVGLPMGVDIGPWRLAELREALGDCIRKHFADIELKHWREICK